MHCINCISHANKSLPQLSANARSGSPRTLVAFTLLDFSSFVLSSCFHISPIRHVEHLVIDLGCPQSSSTHPLRTVRHLRFKETSAFSDSMLCVTTGFFPVSSERFVRRFDHRTHVVRRWGLRHEDPFFCQHHCPKKFQSSCHALKRKGMCVILQNCDVCKIFALTIFVLDALHLIVRSNRRFLPKSNHRKQFVSSNAMNVSKHGGRCSELAGSGTHYRGRGIDW